MKKNILFGAAENIIEVPLFAELGGYGPFRGRRNIGVRDPLFCRVITFNDSCRRNVIIATDTIASDRYHCRSMRVELAERYSLYPESIMFAATHTHSGACLHSCDVGYGEPNGEFLKNWKETVFKTVGEAIQNEEEVRAFSGKAPITKAIGSRRTTSEDTHTDPDIRFVKFVRNDGSVKVLLHNYSMHGVVFGPQLHVSADWMGDANRKIKERKLAEIPFFLYGTAGDINVLWTHPAKERDLNLDWISSAYTDDLESAPDNAEELDLSVCSASLQTKIFPTEEVDPAEYRRIAEKLLEKLPNPFEKLIQYIHDRMIEMAVLAERGKDFRVFQDLQVLKMGDLSIFAVPGEPFLAVGEELRAKSDAKFPLAVSVANGDAGYYPTREMFEQYPSIFDNDDFGAFGFYEVWFGPGQLRPKYKPEIVEFLTSELLKIEKNLNK